jgi:hypothetical protein
VARELKLATRTVRHLGGCSEERESNHIGDVDRLDRICALLNTRLGPHEPFRVEEIVKTARRTFLEAHGGRACIFVGGKYVRRVVSARYPQADTDKWAPAHAAVTDMKALLELQDVLRRRATQAVDVRVELATGEALSKTEQTWRDALNGDGEQRRYAVVLGSPYVNGVFDHGYREVSKHFPKARPFEIVFHASGRVPQVEKVLSPGVEQGYVRWTDREDEIGIHLTCGRRKFFRRGKASFSKPYRDVAVVLAGRRAALLLGSGSTGTLAAVRMFDERFGEINEQLRTASAYLLIAAVDGYTIRDFSERPLKISPHIRTRAAHVGSEPHRQT